jgi:hypothetical protein
MSKKSIIVLMYHRHEILDIICRYFVASNLFVISVFNKIL